MPNKEIARLCVDHLSQRRFSRLLNREPRCRAAHERMAVTMLLPEIPS